MGVSKQNIDIENELKGISKSNNKCGELNYDLSTSKSKEIPLMNTNICNFNSQPKFNMMNTSSNKKSSKCKCGSETCD